MKEILRLYWGFRFGGATKDEAIEMAIQRVGISEENLEWAFIQVNKELSRRRQAHAMGVDHV